MNTEPKIVNQDLVPFDRARMGVIQLKKALDDAPVNDRESRDNAFRVAKGADRILKEISSVRIECLRPLKDEKAKIKKAADDAVRPIDERIRLIQTYAVDGLSVQLDEAVSAKKNEIMVWDEDERKRQEAERRRIEEQERKQREDQERKERAIREAEERRLAKIEVDKQKALQEAEEKKGIERAKAKRAAEETARIASERASEAAAEKAQKARIDGALKRTEFVDQKEDLEQAKTSGRAKQEIDIQIQNLRRIPFEYLLNPKPDLTRIMEFAKEAQLRGVRPQMPGVLFIYSNALKYQ